jgi:hypothetical protein
VVLGGVGLIGLAERPQPERPYPIICPVAAGIAAARQAFATKTATWSTEKAAPVESIGLSPELSALFLR